MTPTPEAREREMHTRVMRAIVALEEAMIDGKGYLGRQAEDREVLNALDAYRTAVRDALVAEMVAGVEEAIRKLPEPNLSQDDKVRYAFAGKMAAFTIVLDNLRPTETTDAT